MTASLYLLSGSDLKCSFEEQRHVVNLNNLDVNT